MAKGQKRSNREIKKPKQKKTPTTPVTSFERGLTAPKGLPKKKA